MPTLIAHVSVNLHKLLENRGTTTSTFCRKTGRIMEMTIYVAIVLVIRVLGAKKSRTQGACEVFYMKLLF